MSPRTRVLLLLLGALLLVGALFAGGLPYAGYEVQYGRFGWGPYEAVFLVNYLLLGGAAVGLAAAAVALGAGDRLARRFAGLGALSGPAEVALAVGAAAAIVVLVTAVRYLLLQDVAITDDENVYAFQARVFASGRLAAPSPPASIRAFFDNQFIVNDGKWYGMFFPGHGFLLAIGELVGATRWVPTASAASTALLAYLIARRAFGRRAAVLTLAGLVLSPYFVMSSATLLAHSTSALFLAVFTYAILRAQDPGASPLWWLAAGLAVGWAGLTRPLAGAAFVLPWTVWLLARLARDASVRRLAGSLLFAAGGAAVFVVLCLYNLALAGAPFVTGYHTYSALYGFPVDKGAVKAPWPLPSLYELGYAVERFNFWLLGWPLSLAPLPFFRRSAEGALIFLATAAVVVAYAASTLPTINATGPAHYSELVPFLVMLAASGLDRLVEILRAGPLGAAAERFALGAVAASVACALIVYVPLYGSALRSMSTVARAPYDLVERQGVRRAVVFVHSLPGLTWRPGTWVYYHRNNSPELDDPVLFVRDLGPRNADLMRALPDRSAFAMGVRENQLLLVPVKP